MIVETRGIQGLTLVEVDDRAKLQDLLDGFKIHLGENGMVVMKTNVTYVDLNLLLTALAITVKLLLDLKESLLDLLLNLGFQGLLHVVRLEVLTLEVLQHIGLQLLLLPPVV